MALSSIQETQPQACVDSYEDSTNPGLRGATAAPLRKYLMRYNSFAKSQFRPLHSLVTCQK